MSDDELLRLPPREAESRPLSAATRLLQGGPVVLLTSRHRGSQNVMPLAWCAPLSANPPLLGIAIERSRHSADMVSQSAEFALNFPARALLHHVQYLATLSGADVDKLEATQLDTFEALHVTAPLIRDCVAWVECEVQQVLPVGDHLLFIGLPVSVRVDPAAFGDRWLPGAEEVRPLHFLGGNHYSQLDGVLEARLPQPQEAPERALAERIEEELELTIEARERRAEQLAELEREVEAGNVIDVSQLRADEPPNLDLPPPAAAPNREQT